MKSMDRHHPVAVANYFISLSQKEPIKLTLLKLIKLVYMAAGWQLAVNECPLTDEAIEAWTYGPVLPSVYHAFKEFGKHPILDRREVYDIEDDQFVVPIISPGNTKLCELLDAVWNKYKNFSAIELSDLTHQQGTAWYQVVNNANDKLLRNTHIPDELIKNEFKNTLNLNAQKKTKK